MRSVSHPVKKNPRLYKTKSIAKILLLLLLFCFKVVRDPCQKITLLLHKSKSVRVIVPESCF